MSTLWKRFYRTCLIGVLLLSVGIVDAQNQKLDAINCALTPDQIVGQAFSGTAGASGETSDSGLTPEGESIETDQLATSADWITSNLLCDSGNRIGGDSGHRRFFIGWKR